MVREMPHDIIDNRGSYLADAVRPLLSQSVRIHFAIGLATELSILCHETLL